MNIKELEKFIAEESERLNENYLSGYDVDKRILHAVAKLSEESGELTEVLLKKIGAQRKIKLDEFKDEQIESEVADVIIVASIIANLTGVSVEKALKEKIKKIEKRYNENGKEIKDV